MTRSLPPLRRAFAAAALLASAPAAAQALDCAARDPQVCAAVNALVPRVNAEAGATVLAQGSSTARMRPTNLYSRLLAVKSAAVAGGCAVDGYSGGVYDATAGGPEAWSGGMGSIDGPELWDAEGVCALAPNQWSGTAQGASDLVIGDLVGLHNADGQIVGNIGASAFQAGVWIRRSGNRGVYAALTGSCPVSPAPVDPAAALDPWWVGALSSWLPTSETVTLEARVDNWMDVYVDGVFVAEHNAWNLPFSTDLDLAPGTHHIAVRARDENGVQAFVLKLTNDEGDVLLTSNTTDWSARTFGVYWAEEPVGWQLPGFEEDGTWGAPEYCGPDGTEPWGPMVPGADLIWGLYGCNPPFMSEGLNNKTLFRATFVVPLTP